MKNFFLIIITGIGIAILYRGCSILEQSREALNWPQTKGDIISSSLTINHLPKFIDPRDDPARWYGTQVQYEYTVGNEEYLSDRLAFQKGDTMDPKEALKVMNKYRRQHEAAVYYNPKNPQESVLQPGYIGDIYMPFMIGGLLTFLGLISFYNQSLKYHRGTDSFIHNGHIYQNQKKFEESLREYNQFIRFNPNLVLGYSSRGNLYFQQGNWDEAIADFNQAIKIDPKDALMYFCLAKAYLGKEQYDKALVNMNKAVENGMNIDPEILEAIKKRLG